MVPEEVMVRVEEEVVVVEVEVVEEEEEVVVAEEAEEEEEDMAVADLNIASDHRRKYCISIYELHNLMLQ
jgi:hypothetical protein